jgi:periplasmic copper chaperone A
VVWIFESISYLPTVDLYLFLKLTSMRFTTKSIAACALFYWATSSFSHVTLEQQSAETSAYTKATLRVGHGCEGLPTVVVRVQIPDGFQGSKPKPKPGWTLEVKRTKLAVPYDSYGTTVTEDVSDITWTANSREMHLPDDQYDEFILRGKTPATAGPLWFKVTQLCKDGDKTGRNPWTEVPASGTSTKALKFPAALLNVINVTAPAASPASSSPAVVHAH